MYKVEKSNVSKVLAVEVLLSVCIECKTACALLMTQKQLTPVFLKMPPQYSLKCISTVVKHLVSNSDNGLVVHLFDAAINLLPYGSLVT